jgi:hypothetical protein
MNSEELRCYIFLLHFVAFVSSVEVYSTDGAIDRYYMSSQNCFHFYALLLMYLLLLASFVAKITTSFSILVSRMCAFYHSFYFIFSS